MAKTVLTDVSVEIDGTAVADHCSAVAMEDSAEEVDVTGFGGNGYREFMQGLKDATITLTLFQDFASGSVHSVLKDLYESGDAVELVLRPTSAPVSEENPEAHMTARLFSYSGINGSVGEASTIEATFRNAGDGITWVTT